MVRRCLKGDDEEEEEEKKNRRAMFPSQWEGECGSTAVHLPRVFWHQFSPQHCKRWCRRYNNWQKQKEEEHWSPSWLLHSMISESQIHSWEDERGLAGTWPRYSPSLVPSPTDESIKGPWRDLQISSRVLGGVHRSGVNDLLLISVNLPNAGAWSHQHGE